MNELGRFASYHEINLAVEHVKQRQQLVDGLAVVGLIQQLDLLPVVVEMSGWSARYDPRTAADRDFVTRLRINRHGLLAELGVELRRAHHLSSARQKSAGTPHRRRRQPGA